MTKAEALKQFKSLWMEAEWISFAKTTRRSMWTVHVDVLHRDGLITDRQANNWTNPFK